MSTKTTIAHSAAKTRVRRARVSISKWINERYPPLHELLKARDVARLTRRPRWMLAGLRLVGRFPKEIKYQGRGVGWRRSEILDWMARDLSVAGGSTSALRARSHKQCRHARLPLRDTNPGSERHKCHTRQSAAIFNPGYQASQDMTSEVALRSR